MDVIIRGSSTIWVGYIPALYFDFNMNILHRIASVAVSCTETIYQTSSWYCTVYYFLTLSWEWIHIVFIIICLIENNYRLFSELRTNFPLLKKTAQCLILFCLAKSTCGKTNMAMSKTLNIKMFHFHNNSFFCAWISLTLVHN